MPANYNGRVLKALGDLGYSAEVVERWDAFSRRKHDLFGIVDILAVGNGHTLAVQVTSRGNMAARRRKALESPHIDDIVGAQWMYEVWGYDQPRGPRTAYRCKIQRLTEHLKWLEVSTQ